MAAYNAGFFQQIPVEIPTSASLNLYPLEPIMSSTGEIVTIDAGDILMQSNLNASN